MLTWNTTQMKAIEDEYFERRSARCPNDGTHLEVNEVAALGTAKTDLIVLCRRCGRTFQSDEARRGTPGTYAGDYEEVSLLDRGGMGEVYIVRHKLSGEVRASKKIQLIHMSRPELVRRFQRESRILESLDHPNIVKVHDTYLDEQGAAIIMEYCSTGSLAQAIAEPNNNTDSSTLASLFGGAVDGLLYLHKSGVVHRDLKPHNILIGADGRAKVADFGLAVLVERDSTSLTRTGAYVGTRIYAAPEQRQDAKHVDHRADYYSMALVAIDIFRRRCPAIPYVLVGLPTELAECLANLLDEEPTNRTVSLQDLALSLSEALSSR